MRQLQSLLWKEWAEAKLFLWIAWGMFIGLPIIGGLEQYYSNVHRLEFSASPWIYLLGPVLAIVIGVAVTCRDLQPKLEDFWQSRPMGGTRLFIVKYFVAATIVLLACGVPLLIEIIIGGKNAVRPGVLWTAFLWLASYSIAFAAGCVLRRTAYAASLAIVGLMLLIFVPVVVPPLGGFNVSQMDEWSFGSNATVQSHGPQLEFAAGMLGVSAVMLLVGLAAVGQHWHLQSSKPLIYSTLAAAFFILLLSASYQLGTNLPILQHAGVRENENVDSIVKVDGKYTAYSFMWYAHTGKEADRKNFARSIAVDGTNLTLSPPQQYTFVRPGQPVSAVNYQLDWPDSDDDCIVNLLVVNSQNNMPLKTIELWRAPKRSRYTMAYSYTLNDRFYVFGKVSMVFDISDPLQPRKLSEDPTPYRLFYPETNEPTLRMELPPARGLSRAERFKFLRGTFVPRFASSPAGDVLCRTNAYPHQQELAMYRLRTLDDNAVTFDRVATYTPTLVQSMVGSGYYSDMRLNGDLLYVLESYNHLIVFDLGGPHPLRLIAHFVSNGSIFTCTPLADGRLLVGGSDIWLLGAPPRH